METSPLTIPDDLVDAVKHLTIENPSDKRLALAAVARPDYEITPATISWLAALVKRKGARYDDENPRHAGPTSWPIE